MKNKRFALISALLITAATPLLAQGTGGSAAQRPTAASRFAPWGVDLSARDPAIKPGDDFWRYANNRWFAANPIPADRQSWGVGVPCSRGCRGAAARHRPDREPRHRSGQPPGRRPCTPHWMDEAGIEARGAAACCAPISTGSTPRRAATIWSACSRCPAIPRPSASASPPIPPIRPAMSPAPARAGSACRTATYYLTEGAQLRPLSAPPTAPMSRPCFALAGDRRSARPRPTAIIALERRIAEAHWTPERSRDVTPVGQSDDPGPAAGAGARSSTGRCFLQSQGLGNVPTDHRPARPPRSRPRAGSSPRCRSADLEGLDDLPRSSARTRNSCRAPSTRPISTSTRARCAAPSSSATAGSAASACSTARSARRSAKSMSAATSRTSSRRQMSELIANLRARASPSGCAPIPGWTRRPARRRWPSSTRSIRGSAIRCATSIIRRSASIRTTCSATRCAAAEFQRNLQLSRLPNPVDRSLWAMTPQTINAYYNPLTNQITFPAAILQPPYFNAPADPAVNYGAIGAIIGHEIGHGFDDQGRRFDATGPVPRLVDAGSRPSASPSAPTRLGAQYRRLCSRCPARTSTASSPWARISAIWAGSKWPMPPISATRPSTASAPVIDGLTGDQRFFLAYAQAWRSNVREGALRQQRADRSAQPARMARQRHRPQRRCLVPRLQHPAGRPAVSAARAARAHLVMIRGQVLAPVRSLTGPDVSLSPPVRDLS